MYPFALKQISSNWVIFADKDMAILRDVEPLVRAGEADGIDLILSVRELERFLNTGFMIVKNCDKVQKLITAWVNLLTSKLEEQITDDAALLELLQLNWDDVKSKIAHIASSEEQDVFFDLSVSEFNVRFYMTSILNNSGALLTIPPKTYVQHFKGIQFLLIERDFSDLRFYKALFKLLLISETELQNVYQKIEIWGSYEGRCHFLLLNPTRQFIGILRITFFRQLYRKLAQMFDSISR